MENNENIVMSRIAFERMQSKDERNDRWRNIIIILLILLLVATNIMWLIAWNEAYLEDKPHTDIEDLSIMYAVRISEDNNSISDAVISNSLLNIWDKTVQDLHDAAMSNIATQKPLLCNLAAYMDFLNENNHIDIEDIDPNDYDMPFFILTNKQKTRGAIMAANPAVMDKITDKFGRVYIIPSSTEEVIIIPQAVVDDVHGLARMVKLVNESEVKPEEQLSNNVYEYDIDSHSLKIAV